MQCTYVGTMQYVCSMYFLPSFSEKTLCFVAVLLDRHLPLTNRRIVTKWPVTKKVFQSDRKTDIETIYSCKEWIFQMIKQQFDDLKKTNSSSEISMM